MKIRMTSIKKISRALIIGFSMVLIAGWTTPVLSESIPSKGSVFPDSELISPAVEKDRKYLGIGDLDTFLIEQVDGQLLFIEVVGVYCPVCHSQFPRNKKLYSMIRKDAKLNASVKMFAVAAGATQMEAAFLSKQAGIPYPVIQDPKFEIHKALGEPKTPFTMLVRKDGYVEYAHFGAFEDIPAFFNEIKKMVR